MYGWIRAARETKGAVTWNQYLTLPTCDRKLLHDQIDAFLTDLEEQMNRSYNKG